MATCTIGNRSCGHGGANQRRSTPCAPSTRATPARSSCDLSSLPVDWARWRCQSAAGSSFLVVRCNHSSRQGLRGDCGLSVRPSRVMRATLGVQSRVSSRGPCVQSAAGSSWHIRHAIRTCASRPQATIAWSRACLWYGDRRSPESASGHLKASSLCCQPRARYRFRQRRAIPGQHVPRHPTSKCALLSPVTQLPAHTVHGTVPAQP